MSCLGDYRFMMLMNDNERELYKEFFEADKKAKECDENDDREVNEEKQSLDDETSSDKVPNVCLLPDFSFSASTDFGF